MTNDLVIDHYFNGEKWKTENPVIYERFHSFDRGHWKDAVNAVRSFVDTPLSRNPCQRRINGSYVGVRKEYIYEDEGALDKADMILILRQRGLSKTRDMKGFLLMQFRPIDRIMYTDVVCTARDAPGKKLIHASLAIARMAEMEFANLRALRHVIDYYKRFGYTQKMDEPGNDTDGYYFRKQLKNKLNWRNTPPIIEMLPPPPPQKRQRVVTPSTPPPPPKKKKQRVVVHPSTSPYSLGQVVWGKIESYPWWPARVALPGPTSPKRPSAKHTFVTFFYDDTVAWLAPTRIKPGTLPQPESKNVAYTSKMESELRKAIALASRQRQ